MKLLLEDDDIEYVRALCGYLRSHNIAASMSGERTFETAPGTGLRVGLWISDDTQFDEALARIKTFDDMELAQRPTSTDFGLPKLVRNYSRIATFAIACLIIVFGIYLLALLFS